MKPRFKLVQSSHYGVYEWVLTHGVLTWHGKVYHPGSYFCIAKIHLWQEGLK